MLEKLRAWINQRRWILWSLWIAVFLLALWPLAYLKSSTFPTTAKIVCAISLLLAVGLLVLVWYIGGKRFGLLNALGILLGIAAYTYSMASTSTANPNAPGDKSPSAAIQEPKRVMVIGPARGEPDWETWVDVENGIRAALQDDSSVDTVPHRFSNGDVYYIYRLRDQDIYISFRSDRGDPSYSTQLARELLDDPRVLLVIGHLHSSVMKEVLPIYMNGQRPMPVIMPVTTNPTLTDRKAYLGLVRMPPTDKAQASRIADTIVWDAKRSRARVGLFSDTINPAYAGYLRNELLLRLRDSRIPVVINNTIPREPAGSLFPDSMAFYKPSHIVFIGMSEQVHDFLAQVEATKAAMLVRDWAPKVLLSDGSVTTQFIKWCTLEDEEIALYGCFPLGDLSAHSARHGLDIQNGPNYSYYAHDAMIIALEAIATAPHLSRELVRDTLQTIRTTLKDRCRSTSDRLAERLLIRDYDFNSDGDNTGVAFHLWRLVRKEGKIRFQHIAGECCQRK